MEGRTSLKLIIEKGPREGETLTYSSDSLIKVGRVVTGNTIAIKDAGISSKHMRIQFDNQLSKWTLCDLDSSNGTVLNGQTLKPYVPSALADGDCIKIGELTSIIVKNEVESTIQPRRNLRRQGKQPGVGAGSGSGSGPAAAVESGNVELGLGFDEKLGKNKVEELVEKPNLRRRILRSSKNEKVSFLPTVNQISENLNADATEIVDLSVPIEPKMTRGRKKKMTDQVSVDPDLDNRKPANTVVVPVAGRRTRRKRKGLSVEPLENAESIGLEESLNNASKSLQVEEGNVATFGKLSVDPLEKLGISNKSAQEVKVEKFVSTQESCEGKDAIADESSSKVLGLDLEEMTLGEFFDYLEVQLPKEIYEKSEKIMSEMAQKAHKCHEFRRQRNENGKG